MKFQAYRPSHDRIIIPNASSEYFKGHFIPVPTPHNTSQQSRWPDLNQVPLAGLWCPTPSDQRDICRENSIRFTLASPKCLDLSPSDALAHSYGTVYTRKSHIDSENSKEHSGGMQGACTLGATRAAVTLCHRREVLNLSAQTWQLKQKIQTETHENIYEVIEVATSCKTSYWRYTSEMLPLKWLLAHDLVTLWVPTLPVTTQRSLALHFRLSLHKQDFKQACELICVSVGASASCSPNLP